MALAQFNVGSGSYQRAVPIAVTAFGTVNANTTSSVALTNASLSQGSLSGMDPNSQYLCQWATPAAANVSGVIIVDAYVTVSGTTPTLTIYAQNTTGGNITLPANVQINVLQL